jgi:hypothetical protein
MLTMEKEVPINSKKQQTLKKQTLRSLKLMGQLNTNTISKLKMILLKQGSGQWVVWHTCSRS